MQSLLKITPLTKQPCIEREIEPVNQDLSQRLIRVLGEEKDLTADTKGDTNQPIIKQDFYREIFESGRGGMIKSYGLELSSDENSRK